MLEPLEKTRYTATPSLGANGPGRREVQLKARSDAEAMYLTLVALNCTAWVPIRRSEDKNCGLRTWDTKKLDFLRGCRQRKLTEQRRRVELSATTVHCSKTDLMADGETGAVGAAANALLTPY